MERTFRGKSKARVRTYTRYSEILFQVRGGGGRTAHFFSPLLYSSYKSSCLCEKRFQKLAKNVCLINQTLSLTFKQKLAKQQPTVCKYRHAEKKIFSFGIYTFSQVIFQNTAVLKRTLNGILTVIQPECLSLTEGKLDKPFMLLKDKGQHSYRC